MPAHCRATGDRRAQRWQSQGQDGREAGWMQQEQPQEQRVVNQPADSVTELRAHSKELR